MLLGWNKRKLKCLWSCFSCVGYFVRLPVGARSIAIIVSVSLRARISQNAPRNFVKFFIHATWAVDRYFTLGNWMHNVFPFFCITLCFMVQVSETTRVFNSVRLVTLPVNASLVRKVAACRLSCSWWGLSEWLGVYHRNYMIMWYMLSLCFRLYVTRMSRQPCVKSN